MFILQNLETFCCSITQLKTLHQRLREGHKYWHIIVGITCSDHFYRFDPQSDHFGMQMDMYTTLF